ncbi:MAG: hypothetical protein RIQ56_283 [Candidatus Parcubacteria bacterium]|jgi:hypothetical protein
MGRLDALKSDVLDESADVLRAYAQYVDLQLGEADREQFDDGTLPEERSYKEWTLFDIAKAREQLRSGIEAIHITTAFCIFEALLEKNPEISLTALEVSSKIIEVIQHPNEAMRLALFALEKNELRMSVTDVISSIAQQASEQVLERLGCDATTDDMPENWEDDPELHSMSPSAVDKILSDHFLAKVLEALRRK